MAAQASGTAPASGPASAPQPLTLTGPAAGRVVDGNGFRFTVPQGWKPATKIPSGFELGYEKNTADGPVTFFVHCQKSPKALPDANAMQEQWLQQARATCANFQKLPTPPLPMAGKALIDQTYEMTEATGRTQRRYTYQVLAAEPLVLVTRCSAPADQWKEQWPAMAAMIISLKPAKAAAEPSPNAAATRSAGLPPSLRPGAEGAALTDDDLKARTDLGTVIALDLGNSRVTDEGLKALGGSKKLQTLILDGTKVTDEGLKELAGLESLRKLGLDCTAVTDEGLARLQQLKGLRELSISCVKFTDAGLAGLKELRELRELNIGGSGLAKTSGGAAGGGGTEGVAQVPVTDDSLAALEGNAKLEVLNLAGTKITDAGLAHLKDIKTLRKIDVSNSAVTGTGFKAFAGMPVFVEINARGAAISDEGLKGIKEIKTLQTLYLAHTKITDAGLEELKSLRSLRTVSLFNTRVSVTKVNELREALPSAKIGEP